MAELFFYPNQGDRSFIVGGGIHILTGLHGHHLDAEIFFELEGLGFLSKEVLTTLALCTNEVLMQLFCIQAVCLLGGIYPAFKTNQPDDEGDAGQAKCN